MSGYLHDRRIQLGLTQKQVADAVGVSEATVSRWEGGQIANMRRDRIARYAKILDASPNFIMTGESDTPGEDASPSSSQDSSPSTIFPIDLSTLKRIPILGRIAAGMPIYAEENIEGYTFTDLNGGHEYFGLRVRGDSMDAAGIKDGYVVIIRRQDIVDNGQIAACLIDGEDATLKRFSQSGNVVTLVPQSTNPTHQPLIFDLKERKVEILGLVVKVEFSPV